MVDCRELFPIRQFQNYYYYFCFNRTKTHWTRYFVFVFFFLLLSTLNLFLPFLSSSFIFLFLFLFYFNLMCCCWVLNCPALTDSNEWIKKNKNNKNACDIKENVFVAELKWKNYFTNPKAKLSKNQKAATATTKMIKSVCFRWIFTFV